LARRADLATSGVPGVPGVPQANKPYGETFGISADPGFAAPGPAIDVAVTTLKNALKTRFGLSETGGSSGGIVW
jgi:hypothetical protein